MKKTINQLKAELNSIVEAHDFLNGFYYGDIATSLNSGEDKVYPALFCNIVAGSMDSVYTYFSIDLFVCDKVDDNHRETVEVESDTAQYLRDFYEVITKSELWKSFSKVTTPLISTRKYQDRLQDLTTGWGASINLGVKSISGICDLPIEGYPMGAPTCKPVLIYENGLLIEVVPSGGEYRYTRALEEYVFNLIGSEEEPIVEFIGLTEGDSVNINGLIINL